MNRETVRRARHILEIFAEAQTWGREVSDEKHGNMRAHHAERKRADNAEQHKRRQFDPVKRAARAKRKRLTNAKRRESRPPKTETDHATALERKREAQKKYRDQNRERERARQRAYREANRQLLAEKERQRQQRRKVAA